jgi:hypothetical protein
MSSIEATLALAIKNYRVIVDSRRFIPLTGQEEFKRVFDLVFGGLLEGFSEVFVFETDQAHDHTAVLSTDSGQASKNATRPERLKVNCKLISLGTDILKLLITLKHFINEPVYADEVLHDVFERAAHLKDFKIVSETSDFDDHKAKKRFETFLVNLYVLLYEDSSLNSNVNLFFCNLSSSRLQTVLFEAAPRASQEEIYRKSYRHLLLNISSINETFPQIIKRLDSYFPEPEMIEGLSRKNFLLDRLGWRNLTVYQCAEKLNQNIIKNCKAGEIKEATRNFQYFWILMAECKFVAVDECCATLFIFPSECESFLKLCLTLSNSFTEITKQNNLTEEEAKIFNEINKEISVWIKKLVKAVSSNYIHFERDINNRSYQKTNKQLYKIIAVLTNFSKGIFDHLQHEFKDLPLHKPASDIKIVADFVFVESTEKFAASTENDAVEMTGEGVSEPPGTEATEDLKATETSTNAEPYTAINITKPTDTDSIVTNADKEQVPIWAIAVAIVSTLIAAFCIKTIFFNSHKN